jgi:hypothetical protein
MTSTPYGAHGRWRRPVRRSTSAPTSCSRARLSPDLRRSGAGSGGSKQAHRSRVVSWGESVAASRPTIRTTFPLRGFGGSDRAPESSAQPTAISVDSTVTTHPILRPIEPPSGPGSNPPAAPTARESWRNLAVIRFSVGGNSVRTSQAVLLYTVGLILDSVAACGGRCPSAMTGLAGWIATESIRHSHRMTPVCQELPERRPGSRLRLGGMTYHCNPPARSCIVTASARFPEVCACRPKPAGRPTSRPAHPAMAQGC